MTQEQNGVKIAASLMALAARTAPKGKGVDTIHIRVVEGKERKKLAAAVKTYGEEHGIGFFSRDAKNIEDSAAVVLIGSNGILAAGIDCGGCGYPGCSEMVAAAKKAKKRKTAFAGPNCMIRMTDLGIAVGSAAKTASVLNADNRVMYSAGVGALSIGILGKDCTVAYGIPLTATGKNIFFDRSR
ncbi:MAG: hypothetical protein A4E35_01684 [Methanoregula sp. PtaU1.Bin051]|nr:MAG: hypothetical protein A4E35_01684 [Methanoregula sp. PtaU1.Bin051]